MSDRIDKFFNARLADHAMAPTQNAWSKLEVNLSKKNRTVIWFRSAAALVFLGLLLSTLAWVMKERIEPTPMATTNLSKEKELAIEDSNQITMIKPDIKLQPTAKKKRLVAQSKSNDEANNVIITEIIPTEMKVNNTIEAESLVVAESKPSKPIVLEFRLEDVSLSASSAQQTSIEVAELDPKSGIQKAIGFALDVKNGDSPIINLRQAKENLFALNFKKDKKTTTQ